MCVPSPQAPPPHPCTELPNGRVFAQSEPPGPVTCTLRCQLKGPPQLGHPGPVRRGPPVWAQDWILCLCFRFFFLDQQMFLLKWKRAVLALQATGRGWDSGISELLSWPGRAGRGWSVGWVFSALCSQPPGLWGTALWLDHLEESFAVYPKATIPLVFSPGGPRALACW